MQQSSKDTETGPPTMVHGSAGATLSKHGTGGTINKPNAPQRRDKCPAKHTGAHYQMIEEKHRKEMEVLNSEIQQRKLELEKKLEVDTTSSASYFFVCIILETGRGAFLSLLPRDISGHRHTWEKGW